MIPYTLKIPVGTFERFTVSGGSNFVLLDNLSTVNVTVKSPEHTEQTRLEPGNWAKLQPFNYLEIAHDGGVDTFVTLYIGQDSMVGGSRVAGDISILGGKVQPIGGADNTVSPPIVIMDVNTPSLTRSFYSAYVVNVGAPTFGYVWQLLNPIGSGKTIAVSKMRVSDNVGGVNTSIARYDAIVVDSGTVTIKSMQFNQSSAASIAQLHSSDAFGLADIGSVIAYLKMLNSVPISYDLFNAEFIADEPVILAAGEGLTLKINTISSSYFQVVWEEF